MLLALRLEPQEFNCELAIRQATDAAPIAIGNAVHHTVGPNLQAFGCARGSIAAQIHIRAQRNIRALYQVPK